MELADERFWSLFCLGVVVIPMLIAAVIFHFIEAAQQIGRNIPFRQRRRHE